MMDIEEKMQRIIDFHQKQTGKNPDAIYLDGHDWHEFTQEVSQKLYRMRPFRSYQPSDKYIEKACIYMGIPVKKFVVERTELNSMAEGK